LNENGEIVFGQFWRPFVCGWVPILRLPFQIIEVKEIQSFTSAKTAFEVGQT